MLGRCDSSLTRGTQRFLEVHDVLQRHLQSPQHLVSPTDNEDGKAFSTGKKGTILGVVFDTEDLTWHWSEVKIRSLFWSIQDVISSESSSAASIRSVSGKIANLATMFPFVSFCKDKILGLNRRANKSSFQCLFGG